MQKARRQMKGYLQSSEKMFKQEFQSCQATNPAWVWIKGSLGTQSSTLLSPACFLREIYKRRNAVAWRIKPRGVSWRKQKVQKEKRKDSQEKPRWLTVSSRAAGSQWSDKDVCGKTELISFGKLAPTEKLNWEKCESVLKDVSCFCQDIKTKNKTKKRNIAPFPLGWPTST